MLTNEEGNKLGLTDEELVFYDALTKPEAVKDFYSNEDLVALTKELAETLRKNKTIDWQKKESARAKMRMIVKKLLKKYKYPPEGHEDALKTVISQCELWTDNVADYEDTVSYSINDGYGTLKVAEKNLTVNNQNSLELNSIFKKYCIFLTCKVTVQLFKKTLTSSCASDWRTTESHFIFILLILRFLDFLLENFLYYLPE